MGIVVLFLSGVFLMNSRVLSLLRGSVESTASLHALNDRVEYLRASTWPQVTDATFYSSIMFAAPPDSAGALGSLIETINVSAHLAPAGSIPPITVSRDSGGVIAIASPGSALLAQEPSVRVDLTASWIAKGGRPKMRQMSLVFGEGGISGSK